MILNLVCVAVNNLYLIVAFFFYAAFFPYRKRWAHHIAAGVLLLFAGCFVLNALRYLPVVGEFRRVSGLALTLLQPIYQFLILHLVFEGSPLPKAALFLCSKVLDVLAAIMASVVFAAAAPSLYDRISTTNWQAPWEALLYFSVPFVMTLIFYPAALLLWRFVRTKKSPLLYQLLLMLIPLSQVALLVLLWNTLLYTFQPVPPPSFLLGGVAVAMLCGCGDFALYQVLLRARHSAELQIRLRSSEMQQQYYSLLEAQQNQVRRLQHDMKNHLDTLRRMAGADTAEQQYLARLYEELPSLKLYYCSSPAVNALLVNKIAEGNALGIEFTHRITLPNPEAIDAVELVALLSNIIDNAFEAVHDNGSEHRRVRFQLLQAKNTVTILCENDLPEQTSAAPFHLDSTKRSHGNGNEIIRRIAEQYNCRPTVTRKDGKYRIVCVLIPEGKKA